MAKKRKCRYTPEELAIHEKAVKLRKMTDAQLVEAMEALKSASASSSAVLEANPNENTNGVKKLLEGLSRGDCKGIKGATAYKISQYAEEMGLI